MRMFIIAFLLISLSGCSIPVVLTPKFFEYIEVVCREHGGIQTMKLWSDKSETTCKDGTIILKRE